MVLLLQLYSGEVFAQVIYWPANDAAKAKCIASVNFADLNRSVVNIVINNDQGKANSGTAWFIDETHIATVDHVITNEDTNDPIITTDWNNEDVFIGRTETVGEPWTEPLQVPVRLARSVITGSPANIVVLEVPKGTMEVFNATPARVSFAKLTRDEAVVAIGYPVTDGSARLVFAVGNYRPPQPSTQPVSETEEKALQYLWFEMTNFEGKDRLILHGGTSGSPVFNCFGEVVAVVNDLVTQEGVDFGAFRAKEDMPTAWGNPTNTAVFSLGLADPMPE